MPFVLAGMPRQHTADLVIAPAVHIMCLSADLLPNLCLACRLECVPMSLYAPQIFL